MPTGITQENTHLTIGSFAQLPTPLPFDPDAVLSLLRKTAVVTDQDAMFVTQIVTDLLPVTPQNLLVTPTTFTQKVLEITDRVGIVSFYIEQHRFHRFIRHIEH